MHLHHLQGVESFYIAKVTKTIWVTNSIKSVHYYVYMIVIYDDKLVCNMLWAVNCYKYMEFVSLVAVYTVWAVLQVSSVCCFLCAGMMRTELGVDIELCVLYHIHLQETPTLGKSIHTIYFTDLTYFVLIHCRMTPVSQSRLYTQPLS